MLHRARRDHKGSFLPGCESCILSSVASEREGERLATENSFDFVRHSMNILVQHKVPGVQPNELRFW